MKDAEGEAFDELAKRQGGGYQAKRQAAMDKINSDFDEEYKKSHAELAKYRTEAQPAQDPVARKWIGLTEKEAKSFMGFYKMDIARLVEVKPKEES